MSTATASAPAEGLRALYKCADVWILLCQDNPMEAISAKEQALKQVSWMDSILSLIPGRKQAACNEPSDEAIKRTHDYLRWPPVAVRWHVHHVHEPP